jgi:YihY family inner membrane protein
MFEQSRLDGKRARTQTVSGENLNQDAANSSAPVFLNVTKRHGRWRVAVAVLKDAAVNYYNENSLQIAGSIAYYSLLCTFPGILLILGLGGLYIRSHELTEQLAVVLDRYLPMKPDVILLNLVDISKNYGRVGIASFLLLLWGSSGVFLPIERALNRAWAVPRGRPWWRSRLVAFEMALIVGFIVLLSSVIVGFSGYVGRLVRQSVSPHFAGPLQFGYGLLTMGASFGLTLLMFLVLFERLINRRISLQQVFPGALVTAVLWEVARYLFTHALPRFNYRHVYGSIGVVVALMTWAYISSAVMLFGAQISYSLHKTLITLASDSPPA